MRRKTFFISHWRKVLVVAVSAGMVFGTACQQRTSPTSPNVRNQVKTQSVHPGRVLPSPNASPQTGGGQQRVIPSTSINNTPYISAEDLAKALNLNGAWNDDKTAYMIGYTGVDTILKAGSTSVSNGEQTVRLSAPPVKSNQKLYITVQDAVRLFGDIAKLKPAAADKGLVIDPVDRQMQIDETQNQNDTSNFFMDDPDDPAKDEAAMSTTPLQGETLPALKNINMLGLVRTSKQYLGVPYKWGARPYPRSHEFDCSSFSKYIYGRYGVYLPRLAGAQSRMGFAVSRTKLRKGDLLFFSVPNAPIRKIGHVGIYIGNHQMINALPFKGRGVQLSNLNLPWWRHHYITARRVAY